MLEMLVIPLMMGVFLFTWLLAEDAVRATMRKDAPPKIEPVEEKTIVQVKRNPWFVWG